MPKMEIIVGANTTGQSSAMDTPGAEHKLGMCELMVSSTPMGLLTGKGLEKLPNESDSDIDITKFEYVQILRNTANLVCPEQKALTWLCAAVHRETIEQVLGDDLWKDVEFDASMFQLQYDIVCCFREKSFLRCVLQAALHHRVPAAWFYAEPTLGLVELLLDETIAIIEAAPEAAPLSDTTRDSLRLGFLRHISADARSTVHPGFFEKLKNAIALEKLFTPPTVKHSDTLAIADLRAVIKAWNDHSREEPRFPNVQTCKEQIQALIAAKGIDFNVWFYENKKREAYRMLLRKMEDEQERALVEWLPPPPTQRPTEFDIPTTATRIVYVKHFDLEGDSKWYFEKFGKVQAVVFKCHGIYVEFEDVGTAFTLATTLRHWDHPNRRNGKYTVVEFRDSMDSTKDDKENEWVEENADKMQAEALDSFFTKVLKARSVVGDSENAPVSTPARSRSTTLSTIPNTPTASTVPASTPAAAASSFTFSNPLPRALTASTSAAATSSSTPSTPLPMNPRALTASLFGSSKPISMADAAAAASSPASSPFAPATFTKAAAVSIASSVKDPSPPSIFNIPAVWGNSPKPLATPVAPPRPIKSPASWAIHMDRPTTGPNVFNNVSPVPTTLKEKRSHEEMGEEEEVGSDAKRTKSDEGEK